jgi:nucleotide-binding universal stress UspA family protein
MPEEADMTDGWFSRIIVLLDGGPVAERAIPVARALAAQAGLPMTLVRVVPDGGPGDDADAYLRARRVEAAGVVDQKVLWGVPAADTILGFLGEHPRSLLVCTTHARSGLGELFLGSVAEELIRRSPVPVLLVGPHSALAPSGDRYQELIMCVEEDRLDPATSRLLPVANDLCRGANLHPWLFRVLEPSTSAPVGQQGKLDGAGVLRRLTETLANDGLEADQQVTRAGEVAPAITFFAGTLSSPIVALSSRRRSLSERMREGSVAVDVARTAPCPLLVVGPSCTSAEELPDHMRTPT